MGNFEKVVVLLILLVCAIVLGISLRAPKTPVRASETLEAGPLAGVAGMQGGQLEDPVAFDPFELTLQEPVAAPQLGSDRGEGGGAPSGTERPLTVPGATAALEQNAGTRPAQPTLNSLVDTTGGRQLALVRADDLRATVSPDFMLYTCRSGDTWHTLAAYYYGQAARADLLQNANEGVARLAAGIQILVPKCDVSIEGLDREPTEPREEPEHRIYAVQSGDTLSGISTEMYGSGNRWMQIYDANRDVLSSPDDVSVGLKLRIP